MTAATREQVVADLLALNGDDKPFAYAAFDQGVVGVWDYADVKWAGILSAGKIDRDYELTVVLHDDATYSLVDRTKDSETTINRKGLHHQTDFFKGTAHKKSFTFGASAITSDHGQVGNTYGWNFDTEEMKRPVRETLERAGWTHRNKSFLDRLFGR